MLSKDSMGFEFNIQILARFSGVNEPNRLSIFKVAMYHHFANIMLLSNNKCTFVTQDFSFDLIYANNSWTESLDEPVPRTVIFPILIGPTL